MKPIAPPSRPARPEACASGGEPVHLRQSLERVERIAHQLGDSHGLLQAHVAALEDRLEVVSAQRLQELDEKERLAKRLQSLLDSLPGGVVVLDGQGVVREANPVARQLLGEPLEGELWRTTIARCFAPRRDDGHEISLKDGRRLSISLRSLDGEPGQLILLTDLTETRRLQTELARHERLSALGRMTASLAHQIRTPLSAALLYASHLSDAPLPAEQQQRFAARLKARLLELEHQVRDMLVFARGDLPLTDRLMPRQLLQALQAAAETHLQGAAVRWQCDAHAGRLLCNRDTLVGALLNLIENGLQAAHPHARLKIHLYCTRRQAADLRQRQRSGSRAGDPRRSASRSSPPARPARAGPGRGSGGGPCPSRRIQAVIPVRLRHLRAPRAAAAARRPDRQPRVMP